MSKYLNAGLKDLAPYTPGEQPREALVKLNTNESPYGPSPKVLQAVAREAQLLNRYPDPMATELRQALAGWLGVECNQVFAGNGSDEILAFCFQAFCDGGAAFADITYGFYRVYAQLYKVDAKLVLLREDFSLAPEDWMGLGRTLFIANPNAPTGMALNPRQLEEILKANKDALVVVDEAYVHFGAQTAVPLLQRHGNLLVVGTFSKSRSLAGGRLGYAVASPQLIEDLERIRYSFNPYNLNRMTLAAGKAAVEDTAYYADCISRIVQTRGWLVEKLNGMDFVTTSSQANFVFTTHKTLKGEHIFHKLRKRGILVRRWDAPRIDNHLRITIGSRQEMETLVDALERITREAKQNAAGQN